MLDKTQEVQHASDPHDGLREEVRAIMARDGITQQDVADQSGVKYGTLTPWMGNKYQGRVDEVAAKVQRWLETYREKERTDAALPKAPSFVLTQTAEDIFAILSFAQNAPDFGVVVGGAGIGKTSAIEHYRNRIASNVYIVTAEPCLSTPHNLLAAIAEEIGISGGRSDRLSRLIYNKLRGANALIVVDESQHLTSAALDQLRTTVLDRAGCGVVVAGNEAVYSRLQGSGESRNAQFAQLYSRVGMRKTQGAVKAKDICDILAQWGITHEQTVALLKVIARKPGALRSMTKTIRLASTLVAGGVTELRPDHIRRAWQQLSATAIDA